MSKIHKTNHNNDSQKAKIEKLNAILSDPDNILVHKTNKRFKPDKPKNKVVKQKSDQRHSRKQRHSRHPVKISLSSPDFDKNKVMKSKQQLSTERSSVKKVMGSTNKLILTTNKNIKPDQIVKPREQFLLKTNKNKHSDPSKRKNNLKNLGECLENVTKNDCNCEIHVNHINEHIIKINAILQKIIHNINTISMDIPVCDFFVIIQLYDDLLNELNCDSSQFLLSYIPIFTEYKNYVINYSNKMSYESHNYLIEINEKQYELLHQLTTH